MNLIQAIEGKHYLATSQEVEALARERLSGLALGERYGMTYLKILVALTAHSLPESLPLAKRRGRKGLPEAETVQQLTALEAINGQCYAAVMRAVVTSDVERAEGLAPAEQSRRAVERNRRTNYARTAMSVLRRYVEIGRDLRDLEAASVTKAQLYADIAKHGPALPPVAAERLVQGANRHSKQLLAEVDLITTADPAMATMWLESMIDQLQARINAIHAPETQRLAA